MHAFKSEWSISKYMKYTNINLYAKMTLVTFYFSKNVFNALIVHHIMFTKNHLQQRIKKYKMKFIVAFDSWMASLRNNAHNCSFT